MGQPGAVWVGLRIPEGSPDEKYLIMRSLKKCEARLGLNLIVQRSGNLRIFKKEQSPLSSQH